MSTLSKVKMSPFETRSGDIKNGYRGAYYYESKRGFTVTGYWKT